MNNKKDSIPQDVAVIGGIDTLYFFADISGDNYTKIYNELILKEQFYENFEFLGYSGKNTGFVGSWFVYKQKSNIQVNGKYLDVKLFRIGFKDPEKQKNVKNVYIQLYADGIYYMGLENLLQFIDELFIKYKFKVNEYYVSRADINAFVNYDFSDIKKEMFKVPSRSVEYIENEEIEVKLDTKTKTYVTDKLETLYFGSRSSDINLKIYNKKKELLGNGVSHTNSKFFIMVKYLKENGIDFFNSDVWNVEFSLKRKALLSYGINTLSDLFQKAGSVFNDLMSKYRFLGYDVGKIEKYRKSRNLSRLPSHSVWSLIDNAYNRYKVVPVKRVIKYYKSDINKYLINTISLNLNDLVHNTGLSLQEILHYVLEDYRELYQLPGFSSPDPFIYQ